MPGKEGARAVRAAQPVPERLLPHLHCSWQHDLQPECLPGMPLCPAQATRSNIASQSLAAWIRVLLCSITAVACGLRGEHREALQVGCRRLGRCAGACQHLVTEPHFALLASSTGQQDAEGCHVLLLPESHCCTAAVTSSDGLESARLSMVCSTPRQMLHGLSWLCSPA